jgi:hypothetical protein
LQLTGRRDAGETPAPARGSASTRRRPLPPRAGGRCLHAPPSCSSRARPLPPWVAFLQLVRRTRDEASRFELAASRRGPGGARRGPGARRVPGGAAHGRLPPCVDSELAASIRACGSRFELAASEAGVEEAKAGVGGGSGGRHRRPRRRPPEAEKLVYERES